MTRSLLLLITLITVAPGSPKTSFKKLFKIEGGYKEYVAAITGIVPDIDRELDIDEFHRDIMISRYLRFSESFPVNLDSDPESEYVSQVVFKNSDRTGAAGADGEILFLIFIQDDKNHNYSLLHFQKFELVQCEYMGIDENAMTFSFHPSKELIPNSSYNYVKFNIQEVSSCGLIMDKSDREDHFIYDTRSDTWEYVTGPLEDDGNYINRMDFAK